METEWVALDLRIQNSESADPRDGSFVMLCSYTTFDNKPITNNNKRQQTVTNVRVILQIWAPNAGPLRNW